jgi:uncharacterized protein
MADLFHSHSRSSRLDRVLGDLLGQAPELLAAAVVSFDGLPMASALPVGMDEDRVAAMSAALLSLGERAAENFGRGSLSQVYVEGENGTVFLVSADDEAVLVAVGAKGAKVGLLMFEVRRSAARVAEALRADDAAMESVPVAQEPPTPEPDPVPAAPALVTTSYPAEAPASDWREEGVPAAAPTLHVVEPGPRAEPEPYIYPVPAAPAAPAAPAEPVPAVEQPYAPYAEQTTPDAPAGPTSPWGNPMVGGPAEQNGWPKNDLGNWTNYTPGQNPPGQPGGADTWS